MTTSYAFTGNVRNVVGAGATAIKAAIGTNLGDLALVDLDAGSVRLPERAPVEIDSAGDFVESLIATNSSGINILDGSLRYILYLSWRDAQGRNRDWNSGYFELVTNTDLSAVAGTDVAVEADAVAAMVSTLVQQEVENHTPGILLGSSTRTTLVTSTATTAALATAIANLSVTITGKGRPVDVRLFAPIVWNSVGANVACSAMIVRDGNPNSTDNQFGSAYSPATNTGPSLLVARTTNPLVDGTQYTFTARLWTPSGQANILPGVNFPLELTVTSR